MIIENIKMIIRFIIFTLLLASQAMADKASKKAEFEQLYAEFSDLYANSDNIDPVIIVAEKLYKLAPRVYGKKSEEYAIVIYNLANLYDEKGGEEPNDTEKKAADLYNKYFRMQNLRKVPKDLNYLNQYIPYMVAYYNSHPYNAKISIGEQMLELAHSLDLQKIELANLEYTFAIQNARMYRYKIAQPAFQKAYEIYLDEFGKNNFKVAETLFWLAKIDLAYEKMELSIEKLLN
ncbi:MAG: hypothetical protein JKY84_04005 [Emcibacteraceae bacterium]|nr:hypothetical protein [Emcibacteraceae bacterium]